MHMKYLLDLIALKLVEDKIILTKLIHNLFKSQSTKRVGLSTTKNIKYFKRNLTLLIRKSAISTCSSTTHISSRAKSPSNWSCFGEKLSIFKYPFRRFVLKYSSRSSYHLPISELISGSTSSPGHYISS